MRIAIQAVSNVKKLQTKMHYQAIGLEINNAGTGVYELMKVAKLPVKPITTVGKITDPKKIDDPTKLSKPNMAKYILRLKQAHKIKFPAIHKISISVSSCSNTNFSSIMLQMLETKLSRLRDGPLTISFWPCLWP